MSPRRLLQCTLVIQLFVVAASLEGDNLGPWHVNMSQNAYDLLGWLVVLLFAASIVLAFKEDARDTLLELAIGITLVGLLFSDALTTAQHDLWPWFALVTFVLWALPLIKELFVGVVKMVRATFDLVISFTDAVSSAFRSSADETTEPATSVGA